MSVTFELDRLVPGTVFLYYGPRRGWLRQRGVAPARVLAIEPLKQIVHVRTLFEGQDGLEVEIGFLPLLFRNLRRSVAMLDSVGELPADAWALLGSWRKQYAQGLVGAFSCDLSEAEELAWQSVREHDATATRENTYVEYAFPRKGHGGVFDTVAVGCMRRTDRTMSRR